MTDKPLPQSIEAEQSIIGTCLVNPDSILDVSSVLNSDMFYLESNKQLYETILAVTKKTGSADLISVCDHLRTKDMLDNFGGVIGITKRTEKIVTDANLMKYVYLVREKYVLRQYIHSGFKLSEMAYAEDLSDVVEYAENTLFNISNFTQTKEPKKIEVCVDEYLIEIAKIINKEKKLSGVASGFTTVDMITAGWQPQDLIVIASRPSMGKTSLALALAKGAAEMKFPTAIFSLEMSDSQLTGRYLSGISGRTNMELRAGKVDINYLGTRSNEIALLPILIDDTPALTIFELRSKVKKLIVKEKIHLVIVDYMQLMKAEAGNREQEVSQISRGLKTIAKEFNIPVIALSQLNRGVEDRADKKPRLADLRESGAIEQDADIVGFIHRPAYYKLQTADVNGSTLSSQGLMILDIAKNRNGACVTIPLTCNEALTKITDYQELVLHNEPF